MVENRASTLLELLVAINREVAGALDLRTVLQRLLFATIQHVGGERGSIIVLDEAGKPVDAAIVYGASLHEHTTQRLRQTLDRGLAGWVIRHRTSALAPDTSLDERWVRRPDDAYDRSGPKAAICVPLLARQALVGVLTIVHSVPHAFGPEHLELAEAIADQASIAVLNARLYNASTRQARIMTALAEGAAAFSSTLDLHQLWQQILSRTMQALQVETAALGIIEDSGRSVVFRAAAGLHCAGILDRRVPAGSGLVGQLIRDGKPRIIPRPAEEGVLSLAEVYPGIDIRAVAVGPIRTGGTLIGVLEAINPAGGQFDSDSMTVLLGIGGLAGAAINNARLYEQMQQARERYVELFEESIDPILLTDRAGLITEANRQAAALTGLSAERLRSMSIDKVHEVDWDAVGEGFSKMQSGARGTYEANLHTALGQDVSVEVHARPVELGTSGGILWTLRDLTERKELDGLRQELTSMVYHDLRSPLGNAAASLALLQGSVGSDDAAKPMVDVAVHSIRRIQRLVNSLLDINRLEAGQRLGGRRRVGPAMLVREAVRDVLPGAVGRQQRIQIDVPETVPNLLAEEDMICRVLINLLENASKFSPEGSQIKVGTDQDGNTLRIWVQDEGPGIPASEQDRIFSKFTRLDHSRGAAPGVGIGLAFCRLAAEAHGGSIAVQSEPGHGARFILSLPIDTSAV
jgi:NtrC-family two-component system sensor histidine kinase KinB